MKQLKGPDTVTGSEEPLQSTNRLGDWYANVNPLPFRGRRVFVFLNQKTLLAVFVPGGGSSHELLTVFVERTGQLLRRLDIPEPKVQQELAAMEEIRLAPTQNKSTLGSLNDTGKAIGLYTGHKYPSFDHINWDREELIFTDRINWPLNPKPIKHIVYPKDLVRELFE